LAFSARSGVSKKNTWRICASNGSMSSAATVERWSESGTVSFSSTVSESLINAMTLVTSSSERRGSFSRVALILPSLARPLVAS
jgi:hypothetical protein